MQGVNVSLEAMTFIGGGCGVLVLPRGSAKVIDCEVIGSYYGLCVGNVRKPALLGGASLEADSVKISKCTGQGIFVGRGGYAKIQRCDIWENEHHGMCVNGNSTSMLMASDVRCHSNKQRGLHVMSQGTATLLRCDMSGNSSGSLYVSGVNSIAKHDQCILDSRSEAVNQGKVVEMRLM